MDTPSAGNRLTIPLNQGWRFHADFVPGTSTVDLPHCWNERDTFQMGVRYAQGTGTYALTFALPAGDAARDGSDCWQLRSEGFYGVGRLRINGRHVCRIDGQYLGLCEDVTHYLLPGETNTIEIELSNAYKRNVLPGKKNPDFLLHGGLAGRVWLEQLPGVCFDDWRLHVSCSDAMSSCPIVRTSMVVQNTLRAPRTVQVSVSLVSPAGDVVASGSSEPVRLASCRSCDVRVELGVDNPERWDLESPALYRAHCQLEVEGDTVDSAATRFGIREAVFDGERGFMLNGKRVALHGVNRHESIPGFGSALPAELQREDAQQIHDLGLNFVRLSHYPQHPAFLDACDELGLLVYAEIASWKSARPGPWTVAACRQLRSMIQRDRNHPSVILWGFANESRSRLAFTFMQKIARELDSTRATVYAENHLHRGIRWRTLRQTDVLGINYELDRLDDAHRVSRHGSVVISEVSNCAYTGRGDAEAELKQIAAWERDFALVGDRPFVAGYALWCFADYASQRRDRCRRRPGMVDAWRVPKMSASYIQAMTASDLFVAAHGDWGLHTEAAQRQIHLFSNAERLVLSAGGNVLADVPAKRYTLVTVPFVPAVLQVSAHGQNAVREAILAPYGKAVSIRVQPDQQAVCLTKRTTVGVLVKVVDADGVIVSDYHGDVHVSVTGPGRARYFTPRDIVEVHAGTGRCFVTGTGETGHVTIDVTEDSLSAGSATIEYTDG
jgi:beta-galactosidase